MLEVRSTTNSGSSGSAVYESARAVDEYLQVTYKQDPLMFSSIDIERVLAYAAALTVNYRMSAHVHKDVSEKP